MSSIDSNPRPGGDMVGQVAMVTGATSGLGLETAAALAARGMKVIFAVRNQQKAERVAAEIRKKVPKADLVYPPAVPAVDFQHNDSIKHFAAAIKERNEKLAILINNAGANRLPNQPTPEGVAPLAQANYLGPWLLTHLLEPLLVSSRTRVVFVSSMTARTTAIRDPKVFLTSWWHSWYKHTKLAVTVAAFEFQRRLGDKGVTVVAVDPGGVNTAIWTGTIFGKFPIKQIIQELYAPAEDAADTLVHAATVPWEQDAEPGVPPSEDLRFYARGLCASPLVTHFDGALASWTDLPRWGLWGSAALVHTLLDYPLRHYSHGRLCAVTQRVPGPHQAYDPQLAKQLWQLSEQFTGLSTPAANAVTTPGTTAPTGMGSAKPMGGALVGGMSAWAAEPAGSAGLTVLQQEQDEAAVSAAAGKPASASADAPLPPAGPAPVTAPMAAATATAPAAAATAAGTGPAAPDKGAADAAAVVRPTSAVSDTAGELVKYPPVPASKTAEINGTASTSKAEPSPPAVAAASETAPIALPHNTAAKGEEVEPLLSSPDRSDGTPAQPESGLPSTLAHEPEVTHRESALEATGPQLSPLGPTAGPAVAAASPAAAAAGAGAPAAAIAPASPRSRGGEAGADGQYVYSTPSPAHSSLGRRLGLPSEDDVNNAVLTASSPVIEASPVLPVPPTSGTKAAVPHASPGMPARAPAASATPTGHIHPRVAPPPPPPARAAPPGSPPAAPQQPPAPLRTGAAAPSAAAAAAPAGAAAVAMRPPILAPPAAGPAAPLAPPPPPPLAPKHAPAPAPIRPPPPPPGRAPAAPSAAPAAAGPSASAAPSSGATTATTAAKPAAAARGGTAPASSQQGHSGGNNKKKHKKRR